MYVEPMYETVMITGASSGFGEETARLFAANGYKVILAARRIERLHELKAALGDAAVLPLRLDVRDRAMVQTELANLPEAFSKVDVLVNCAGLALGLEPAYKADLDDWDTMIDTNVRGLTYCTHSLLPGMVERNKGHIVNIGSTAGTWPYPGSNSYGASKAFVKLFSSNLRADLLGTNVRVSCIEPGLAETDFSVVRFKGDAEKAKGVYAGTQPLRAQDVANIIFWTVQQPPHVNINNIEVMPVCQAWTALAVHRGGREEGTE